MDRTDEATMTKAERAEIAKLVRLRGKLAKSDAERRSKWLLANVEQKLAAVFSREDESWAGIVAEAEAMVDEANAKIAAICRQRGIPDSFHPEMISLWAGRGENATAKRRAELRKVATTQIAAMLQEANLQIDRETERQLTQLTAGALTSTEARTFLDNMPRAEDLLPPLASLPLQSGERIELAELENVTRVTGECNGVTDGRNGRDVCAHCGKALAAGRGRYCSNACRQAAYRQRQATGQGGAGAALLLEESSGAT
jgi:hypothetical protein